MSNEFQQFIKGKPVEDPSVKPAEVKRITNITPTADAEGLNINSGESTRNPYNAVVDPISEEEIEEGIASRLKLISWLEESFGSSEILKNLDNILIRDKCDFVPHFHDDEQDKNALLGAESKFDELLYDGKEVVLLVGLDMKDIFARMRKYFDENFVEKDDNFRREQSEIEVRAMLHFLSLLRGIFTGYEKKEITDSLIAQDKDFLSALVKVSCESAQRSNAYSFPSGVNEGAERVPLEVKKELIKIQSRFCRILEEMSLTEKAENVSINIILRSDFSQSPSVIVEKDSLNNPLNQQSLSYLTDGVVIEGEMIKEQNRGFGEKWENTSGIDTVTNYSYIDRARTTSTVIDKFKFTRRDHLIMNPLDERLKDDEYIKSICQKLIEDGMLEEVLRYSRDGLFLQKTA